MDESNVIKIILILVALLCSAFFSGSEAAFLSIQRGKLSHLVRNHVKGASEVDNLVKKPEKLLPTVLTGNNLANTAAAALATAVAASFFSPNTAIIVATGGVTVLLLIIGETIPKTVATKKAERIAIFTVAPLKIVGLILFPAIWFLLLVSNGVTKILNVSRSESVTEEEIRALILTGQDEGALEPQEAEMLERVFRFGDRPVREVMTPRTELVAIPKNTALADFLDTYREYSHTRFPVYEGNLDNVIGILSIKDVLTAMAAGELENKTSITEMVRPIYFTPETKLIGELFAELRSAGSQIAMVVDEFGGVSGLVTIKHLVEEVVGPVGEKGEAGEIEVSAIDENTFELDGGMRVEDANDTLKLGIPDGDYETIAGFLLRFLGHIPIEGESLSIYPLNLEIIEMRGVKIERVRVTHLIPETG